MSGISLIVKVMPLKDTADSKAPVCERTHADATE